jgi:hypothetical protein
MPESAKPAQQNVSGVGAGVSLLRLLHRRLCSCDFLAFDRWPLQTEGETARRFSTKLCTILARELKSEAPEEG